MNIAMLGFIAWRIQSEPFYEFGDLGEVGAAISAALQNAINECAHLSLWRDDAAGDAIR